MGIEVVGTGDVDKFVDLVRDRLDHSRMGMSGYADRHSSIEIEEDIAVDVLEHGAAAAPHDQWIAAGIGWRDKLEVPSIISSPSPAL